MKNLLTGFLLIFAVTLVSAQNFGFRAGANFATQHFDGDGINFEPDSRVGLYIGAIAAFDLTDALKLRLELNYNQNGFKIDDEFLGETENIVNHLDVPILIQYDIAIGDGLGAYLAVGPQIGFALNGKSKSGDDEEDLDFDEDEYRRLDLGLAFGGGFGFAVGDNMLMLELRYNYGLANLDTSDDNDDIKITNRGLQVGLAFML